MANITVNLPDPVETHQGMVSIAEFREPTARDLMALGDPQQVMRTSDGGGAVLDRDEVLLAYMERLIQAPLNPVLIGSTTLANGFAMRSELLSFFGEARERAWKPLSTPSS